VSDNQSTTEASVGDRFGRVPSSHRSRWTLLCGILAVAGCLALTWSPLLPWLPDDSYGVTTNGLNAVSGGIEAPAADTSQTDGSSSDGSGQPIPSLSAIQLTQGGTEANARHGVFVLVLGAAALLISVLALAGEARRRRRMARDVCALAVLALLPLLYDGIGIKNSAGGVGSGVTIGLLGALAAALGSAWVSRSLRNGAVGV